MAMLSARWWATGAALLALCAGGLWVARPAAAAPPGRYTVFIPGVGLRAPSNAGLSPAAVPAVNVPVNAPAAVPSPTPSPTPTRLAGPARPNGAYYISSGGDDRRDGRTPATAWRTFANVRKDIVKPGSAILAEAGGVWEETVRVPVDDLHFGVYGTGPKPKIVAPDLSYAFHSDWKKGIRLEGWELTSSTRRGARWGIVHISEGDYVVRDVVVHGADGWMFMTRGARGLVENSEFYDNDGEGPTTAVSIGGHEYEGRPPASDATIFRNNFVHDTYYRAVANWGSNVIIENNRIERWSRAGREGSATQAPAGIYVPSRYLGDVIVRGNILVGTGVEHWGLWVDTGPEDRTIVEGNTVRNARRCMWAEKTSNVIFRNNRCEAVWETGVWWGSGEVDPAPSRNGQILDNEFVGPTPQTGWIRIFPRTGDAAVQGNRYLP